MTPDTTAVTRLLRQWQGGEASALEELTPLVYHELRRIASGFLRRERAEHTLQPTALLHEAYLRLVDQRDRDWKSRAHFYGVAAHLMRLILVDYARSKSRLKRGGDVQRVDWSEALLASTTRPALLTTLDDALCELEKLDPRKGRVVELRYFGGLSLDEAAEVLGISTATVGREQRMAEAWLQRQMTSGPHGA
ncbi:sigma-70 family RNA polymerase sigma factor [uncultured Paludibaculum sp.]|uniref:sigma-70 family RNA polymerase sigma factor n=1 Tax=uncultured Paludibaculum sp. TaxID=1765020 RepID=UPI002AABF913|nr:sigma-70 family RNA polymerase sigma factor [uncultured Paludibaculum sp.]